MAVSLYPTHCAYCARAYLCVCLHGCRCIRLHVFRSIKQLLLIYRAIAAGKCSKDLLTRYTAVLVFAGGAIVALLRRILGWCSFKLSCWLRANSSISAMRPQCYYLLEEIVILGVIYGSLVGRVCNPAAPAGPRGIPGLSPGSVVLPTNLVCFMATFAP